MSVRFDYWGRVRELFTKPGTSLTNSDLVEISKLSNLRSLNLVGTGVSDAGLVHLEQLRNLTHLNLGGQPITNNGIQYLAKLKNLKEIDLTATRVTPTGIQNLTLSISGLKKVRINVRPREGVAIRKIQAAKPGLEIVGVRVGTGH